MAKGRPKTKEEAARSFAIELGECTDLVTLQMDNPGYRKWIEDVTSLVSPLSEESLNKLVALVKEANFVK